MMKIKDFLLPVISGLVMRYILHLRVTISDYLFTLLYGLIIAYMVNDKEFWTLVHLDLLFSLWTALFSSHAVLISKRNVL